jgi:carboxymethylenebutenolidase
MNQRTDDETRIPQTAGDDADGAISRRDFAVLSVGAGLATVATQASAQAEIIETAVDVKTPDGSADSYLYRPGGAGTWPAVIVYPDALALRPAFRDMGRRLASHGYVTLVPNFFYRSGRSPVLPANFAFGNPESMALLNRLREPLNAEAVTRDALAYLDFLAGQPSVRRGAKMGAQGYCMTGAFAMRTAAAAQDRVGAIASFHGGGLATQAPDSPHLLAPRLRNTRVLIAIAENDDARAPADKETLRSAFQMAGVNAVVEVFPGTLHGWCVKDMGGAPNAPIYNPSQAEIAWAKLLSMYQTALV